MQRHPSLRPLSRRHQGVLLRAREIYWRARRIRRGTGDPQCPAVRDLIAFVDEALTAHFEAERDILAVALRARDDGLSELLDRLAEGQDTVLGLVEELRALAAHGQQPSAEQLEAMCAALREHVRLCEHEVYPAAESCLDERGLEQVEHALGAFKV